MLSCEYSLGEKFLTVAHCPGQPRGSDEERIASYTTKTEDWNPETTNDGARVVKISSDLLTKRQLLSDKRVSGYQGGKSAEIAVSAVEFGNPMMQA